MCTGMNQGKKAEKAEPPCQSSGLGSWGLVSNMQHREMPVMAYCPCPHGWGSGPRLGRQALSV